MLRRYSFCGQKGSGNAIVAMIDGTNFHGGLTDRWKGIVSLYALSKAIGRDFRIHYTYPFLLTMFQEPNTYDWRIDNNDLSHNLSTAHMLRLTGESSLDRMMNLEDDKQIHCYANRDWIHLINKTFNTSYEWGVLFSELFKPSQLLQTYLDSFSEHTAKPYVAVAYRMQNLLGDYLEYQYQPAFEKRQKQIIEDCISCLETIHTESNMPILVTSDSKRMTDEAARLPYVFTNSQYAAHADTTITADYRLYMKSFADFYLLAGATKVYAPRTKEMYESDFPLYASKLGGRDFLRIEI